MRSTHARSLPVPRASVVARGSALLLASVLVVGSAARAQPTSEAQSLFRRGLEHVERGELAFAATAFERSLELHPRASTAYNLASVLFALGRVEEARLLIARALELAPRDDLRLEIEALARSLPSVPPPDVSLPDAPSDVEVTRVAREESVLQTTRRVAAVEQGTQRREDTERGTRRRRTRIALASTGAVSLIAILTSVFVVVRRDEGTPYRGTGVF
jgi:tetratricopeptide (TPR) repeat protein